MHEYAKVSFYRYELSLPMHQRHLSATFLPLLMLLALLLSRTVTAQETGVRFERGLSWAQVQAKAKAENKYIFMDCFTTWCGPCKHMRNVVFPQAEMGNFFNDKFVSVEVQLDTTSKDDEHVKSWYADGHAIMKEYSIKAFPTYLIFTPDGRPLHRIVGSGTPTSFIKKVQDAFDTTKQYYTKLKQFENGRRDTGFLRQFAIQVNDAYDLPLGMKVTKAYLAAIPNRITPAALDLMLLYTSRSTDEYFSFIAGHANEINGVLGAGKAEEKIRSIFLREGRGIRWNDKQGTDWKNYQKKIRATLPAHTDEITMRINIDIYLAKRDWPQFEKALTAYMKQYSKQMSNEDMNNIAWTAFEKCSDMTCVSKILELSSQLKSSTEPAFLDTYANLLYKTGKIEEAMVWQQKAVDASRENERPAYQTTLDKMKKGQKTWN
ncbi:thioredoxin family protein [Longitalea arenae]|uniref:thioredoxin family protein n=1 Tax=Longitalea arenae TaxID=2812558 RepID=UPI00196845FD|nr:thioredoxin fold domain-containing protein [Longitalea arenae]